MNAFTNSGKRKAIPGSACRASSQTPMHSWPSELPALGELRRKLQSHHAVKSSLCTALERIADKLPDEADMLICRYVAKSITPVVRRAHEFEENEFFPALRTALASNSLLQESLLKLSVEHTEDLSFAEEIEDVLTTFADDPHRVNAETLGYMLRGFFEGTRRHMEFERIAILSAIAEYE